MIELTAAGVRASVSPADGGRLASLMIAGTERLVTGPPVSGDPKLWGCYPMAPWAGRLRRGRLAFAGRTHQLPIDAPPHAIHGTVYNQPWDVQDDGSLLAPFGPTWPFGGHARLRFDLAPGRLRCTLEVHADREAMPASAGFHPWFARPVELAVQPAQMYQRDAEGMPDGRLVAPRPLPWDDCFRGLAEPPRLTWPDGLTVTVSADVDDWVLYTPSHAICVEPQTAPPDGPNLSPYVVEPGAPLVLAMTLTWAP